MLCLNETILEETSGAKTCIYDLKVDGQLLGRVKSSGIIISTGTGSTGVLLSARRPRFS